MARKELLCFLNKVDSPPHPSLYLGLESLDWRFRDSEGALGSMIELH